MATAWPSTLPDPYVDFHEEWDMPVVKTTTEMGIDKVRPMFTVVPRTFTVTFTALTEDEKDDLTDFFETIGWGGGTIEWTYPADASTMYVKLVGPLYFIHLGSERWSTSFVLKRVPDAVAV